MENDESTNETDEISLLGMASSQIPIVRTIFASAVSRQMPLSRLALVSHEWSAYAKSITIVEKLQKLKIRSKAITQGATPRQALLGLRRQLTLRRGWVCELHVSTDMRWSPVPAVSLALWCSLLAQTPRVNTLDIARNSSDHTAFLVPVIVKAAARQCSRLQRLRVPLDDSDSDSDDDSDSVLAAVTESLPAWKPLGGFRELSISLPFATLPDPHTKSEQFVSAIAANCPHMETIGYGDDPDDQFSTDMDPDEEWYISLLT
jgi:hypothetical protein